MRSTFIAVAANVIALGAALLLAQWSLAAGFLAGAALVTAATMASERRLRLAVATAVHELRNPLAVVRGALELVRDGAKTRLTPKEQGFLGDAVRNTEAMKTLLADLGAAAIDPPITHAPVQLGEVINGVVRDAQTQFPGREVTIACSESVFVDADELRVRQILTNLLINALALEPPATVSISALEQGADVLIRVADDGPGIPVDVQRRLFKPLVTSKASHGGMGLGLAVAFRLATRLGGSLRLEAASDRRTIFVVRLRRPRLAA